MWSEAKERHERALKGIKRIESRLSFQFAVMQRLLDRQITRVLEPHEISLASYRIMVTIDAFEEMSAADLVRLVVVDKAMVSRTCAELIAVGYIDSRPDPKSARRKLLSLSKAGKKKLSELEPDVAARNAGINRLFEPEERAGLEAMIAKLTNHIASALEGSPDAPTVA